MRRWLSIVLVLAALTLSACAQAAQKAVEQATGVQTDQNGETVTIKGKDGESVVVSSQLPDELKDFPVPQGFTIESGGSMASGGDKMSVASWIGTGTLQTVQEFYQKTLPGQGWKEESVFTSGDGGMLSYSKGEQGSLTITTSKDGDKVEISVIHGKGGANAAAGGAAAAAGQSAVQTGPTATPEPPKTTDASVLPDEIKRLSVPGGFSVVSDSVSRHTEGGKFSSASATWFGKMSVKEVGEFYKKALPSQGWTEESASAGEESMSGDFVNEKEGLRLYLQVQKVDAGTEVYVEVVKN